MRQETTTGAFDVTLSAAGQSAIGGSAGGAWQCDHKVDKTVQLTGTWTGSVSVLASIDGTNYAVVAGPVTANSILMVPQSVVSIALSAAAGFTGTCVGIFSCFNSRSDPG